jgi:radical SAM/Cys-rich protein
MNRFDNKIQSLGIELQKQKIDILQVNLGKLCNIACVHCHVEAGPNKKEENMSRATAEAVVRVMDELPVSTLDLTGGAPELNPNFKYLVCEATERGMHVIDRCNLTVFYEKGMEGLVAFLAENKVEVIASLPCYSKENVEKQRGRGVFDASIQGLIDLNRAGYGRPETDLVLNLVYNPVGPHLPPEQLQLEADYKIRLFEDFGIVFNRLYCIANMPITRYAKYLNALDQYDAYVELLINRFNPHAIEGLMCRNTLSVGWDGRIYDCDFNQALNMSIRNGKPLTIFDLNVKKLDRLEILTGEHCFGCTAGAGSSCQGALR